MPATTQEEILSGILPKVIIDKITLTNNSDNTSLKVTLNLIIKETLQNDQIGTWFNDINILKYVKIQVIQSKDPIVTKALSYSNDIIRIVDLLNGRTFSAQDLIIRGFAFATNLNSTRDIRNLILGNVQTQEVALNGISTNSLNTTYANNRGYLERYSAYKNNDGDLIYEIPYETSFELPNNDLQHLAYFAVSRIDLEALTQDFNISYDYAEALEENGRVSSEIIIDNYNVISKTNAYIDETGSIWDGAVHLGPNGEWKSGDDETVNSILLTQIQINNNKIQDFRNIAEIEKLILNFNELELSGANVFNLAKVSTLNFNYIPNKEEPIFSELFCSHDSVSHKIIFGIDFNNAIKQYSSLGSLFDSKNDLLKQEILNRSKILKLDVTLKRVERNVNTLNDVAEFGTRDFQSANSFLDREFLLASSKDLEWGNFLLFTDEILGSLKEERFVTSEKYNVNPYFVRYFSFINRIISNANLVGFNVSGLYQYGVNLEIEDGTVKLILEKIYELNESKNKLLAYYNKVTTPTMKKFILESSDPLTTSVQLSNTNRPEFISYGFDIVANKISNQLADTLETEYGNNAPWSNETAIFIDAIQTLSLTPISQEYVDNYVRIIQTFLNPRSGNPASINKVIELYDTFISSLSKLVKINENTLINQVDREGNIVSTNPGFLSLNSTSPSGKETRTFKISKTFDNIIDSDNLKKIGVDYLNFDFLNSIALMDSKTLSNRVNGEVDKYFTSRPDNNLTINNTLLNISAISTGDFLSYLSPIRFIMPTREFITSPSAIQYTRNREVINLYDGNIFEKACQLLSDICEVKLQNYVVNNSDLRIYAEDNPNISGAFSRTQRIKQDLAELFEIYGGVTFKPINMPPPSTTGTGNDVPGYGNDYANSRGNVTNDPNNLEEPNLQSILKFLISSALPISKQQKMSFGFSNMAIDKNKFIYNYNNEDPIKKIFQLDLTNLSGEIIGILLSNLPYHIQSLLLKSRQFIQLMSNFQNYSDFNKSIESRLLNYINFENLMKIEYLDSFLIQDNSTGTIQQKINLKNATWKILTRDLYNRIGSTNRILCRLVPYENIFFNLSVDIDIAEGVYDKYFLVQGADPVLPPGSVNIFSTGADTPNQQGEMMPIQTDTTSVTSVAQIGTSTNITMDSQRNRLNVNEFGTLTASQMSDSRVSRLRAFSTSLSNQTKFIKNTSTTNNLINNIDVRKMTR